MNSNTFGNSRCHIQLAAILTELNSEKINRKVKSLFDDFRKGLLELRKLESNHIHRSLLSVWYESIRSRVQKIDLPPKVKTHLLASIKASYYPRYDHKGRYINGKPGSDASWWINHKGRSIVRLQGTKVYDGPTEDMPLHIKTAIENFKPWNGVKGDSSTKQGRGTK